MEVQHVPVVTAQMLIRRPVDEVFAAFVDPDITTKFWFTKSSGPLEAGKAVRWEWEMYGVSADVQVKALEKNQRILIEWPGFGAPTRVEWTFESRPDGNTLVIITNSGFAGNGENNSMSGDSIIEEALDSKGGFTFVLAGLKAYLEHGIELNLIADHAPDAVQP